MSRQSRSAVLLLAVAGALLPSLASADVTWRRASEHCEPPSVFYSPRHRLNAVPCCATQVGVCPGGQACPPSGACPGTGTPCSPPPAPVRPNVILFISDDQGYCFYGSAGECRSTQTGTPIYAPATPNLDRLAGYGTVFPVAHNTASWCYPALNSILTGRFQKSFEGHRTAIGQRFTPIARAVKSLGGAPGFKPDPFDSSSVIGGYCTFLGGKFTALAGDPGFDAGERGTGRSMGRLACVTGPDGSPKCGTDQGTTYAPLSLFHANEVLGFMDAMLYRVPGTPSTYTTAPFFVWYAPRIPHAPLDAPAAIKSYLFGSQFDGLGGLFDLGGLCTGSSCPPVVSAFGESNFGTVRDYYANIYWVDDNVRELRKFLGKASQPHCIGGDGLGRYDVASAAGCRNATWATQITPAPDENTVIIYLTDNGWQLPNSKHGFGENGYRTRLIVFDPRLRPDGVDWQTTTPPPAPYESPAVAHSTDLLPTIVGLARGEQGRQSCPASDDGTLCDGRDLRAQLKGLSQVPAPAADLRHALCGHQTQRGTAPSRARYLLTRPDSVGRCVLPTAPACSSDAQCASGRSCVAGRCIVATVGGCGTVGGCQPGAACIGGKCQPAPVCLTDATCGRLLPGQGATCQAKGAKWCRNAPTRQCGTNADCPVCPSVNGRQLPCGRVCEPHLLKMYVSSSGIDAQLEDLFADPDENERFSGKDNARLRQMSDPSGPYGDEVRQMACCIDDWWPAGARGGTLCGAADACPADLVCNR